MENNNQKCIYCDEDTSYKCKSCGNYVCATHLESVLVAYFGFSGPHADAKAIQKCKRCFWINVKKTLRLVVLIVAPVGIIFATSLGDWSAIPIGLLATAFYWWLAGVLGDLGPKKREERFGEDQKGSPQPTQHPDD